MRGFRRITALTVLAGGLLAAVPPLAAQGATADFQPVDYVVTLDGAAVDAEVWQSRIAGELLIVSPDLASPVRLILREARAETVQFMKVDRRPDGGLTLLPDATERSLGTFQVAAGGDGVSFALDGRTVELKQKPPLLGTQDLGGMKAYSREYTRLAEEYTPSKPFIERLRAEDRDVRVEVYFGSWCPFCQQMVPRMIRVAEELADSEIEVDFYGLPQGEAFARDPKAKALDISGVPTGVVYVDGRETGRITANGWKIPEVTLNRLLGQR
jgi:thiol-disulfide isomerase/thioredoxin